VFTYYLLLTFYKQTWLQFLPARHSASTGTGYGPVSLCLCLRLSVTSRSSIETDKQIGLVLAWELPSTYATLYYKEIRVPPKNKGSSLWNFAHNSRLRKFRHDRSIVEACYQLSSRKVDSQSMMNWTVSSIAIVYHRNRQALSTARFCRARVH